MFKKILFISNNNVISYKFKQYIEKNTKYKCDILTNKYLVDKLNYYNIISYKRIIIHSERGELFPNAMTTKKLFMKYPNKQKFILYKYGPSYPDDIDTAFYSKVILREHFTLYP
tara:strand:+ start:169 stop:510 length:342 start_codon:yes stop_codon:yes gene_type:complete